MRCSGTTRITSRRDGSPPRTSTQVTNAREARTNATATTKSVERRCGWRRRWRRRETPRWRVSRRRCSATCTTRWTARDAFRISATARARANRRVRCVARGTRWDAPRARRRDASRRRSASRTPRLSRRRTPVVAIDERRRRWRRGRLRGRIRKPFVASSPRRSPRRDYSRRDLVGETRTRTTGVVEGRRRTRKPRRSSRRFRMRRLKGAELAPLLDAKLADIADAWTSGRLRALGFDADEVAGFVRAVFEDTENRRRALADVEVESRFEPSNARREGAGAQWPERETRGKVGEGWARRRPFVRGEASEVSARRCSVVTRWNVTTDERQTSAAAIVVTSSVPVVVIVGRIDRYVDVCTSSGTRRVLVCNVREREFFGARWNSTSREPRKNLSSEAPNLVGIARAEGCRGCLTRRVAFDESQTRFPRDMHCRLAIGFATWRGPGGTTHNSAPGYHHHARRHPSSILHRVPRRRGAAGVRLYAVRARATAPRPTPPRAPTCPRSSSSFESISRDDATADLPPTRAPFPPSLDPSTRRPRPTLTSTRNSWATRRTSRGPRRATSPSPRWTPRWRRSSSARRRASGRASSSSPPRTSHPAPSWRLSVPS